MKTMMEYKGYHADFHYDADDEVFCGHVFGIRDSLNFYGTSVTELKEMFHQSIDDYLEFCRKHGKEPEKEFKGVFNVRVSPEVHRLAALKAADEQITMNQLVSNILTAALAV
ncbi:MAG: type II toxin-antitoxin system HicB family antitoxin [Clostridia bacterium]|nr:type II toxin-antitoxin system HicB family antitoxin [Clostridia bacterium]